MSHLGNDILVDFETDNFEDLAEKFVRQKEVIGLWADFVYSEYEKSLKDIEPDEDDNWHPEDENKEPNPENRG